MYNMKLSTTPHLHPSPPKTTPHTPTLPTTTPPHSTLLRHIRTAPLIRRRTRPNPSPPEEIVRISALFARTLHGTNVRIENDERFGATRVWGLIGESQLGALGDPCGQTNVRIANDERIGATRVWGLMGESLLGAAGDLFHEGVAFKGCVSVGGVVRSFGVEGEGEVCVGSVGGVAFGGCFSVGGGVGSFVLYWKGEGEVVVHSIVAFRGGVSVRRGGVSYYGVARCEVGPSDDL